MKTFILAAMVVTFLSACEGTGDRTYKTAEPDTGPVSTPEVGDTTATSNQGMYNTDSAAAQGSAYDTSNRNDQGNTP